MPRRPRTTRRPRSFPARTLRAATSLWRNPRTQRALPWTISLLLHTGVIVGAGLVVWRVRESRDRTPPMVVRFDEPAIAPAMAEPPAPPPEPDASAALDRILAQPADSIPDEAPALPAPSEPPPIIAPPEHSAPASAPTFTTEPMRVEFSGLGASDARDIVYVVDASGSMVTSLPSVLAQLRRSLTQLHPTQRFQVFLFRSPVGAATDAPQFVWPAIPPGTRRPILIDATRANKAAVFTWADTIPPRFRSNPLPALEAALALKPDAIFLLSAGATDTTLVGMSVAEVLDRLDRLNPRRRDGSRRVVIRAIQVLEDDPAGLLRRIATAHGGESGYKFISREDLARQSPDGARP